MFGHSFSWSIPRIPTENTSSGCPWQAANPPFDDLGPDILTDILQYPPHSYLHINPTNNFFYFQNRYLGVADVIAFSQVCKNFHFFTTGNRGIWKCSSGGDMVESILSLQLESPTTGCYRKDMGKGDRWWSLNQ